MMMIIKLSLGNSESVKKFVEQNSEVNIFLQIVHYWSIGFSICNVCNTFNKINCWRGLCYPISIASLVAAEPATLTHIRAFPDSPCLLCIQPHQVYPTNSSTSCCVTKAWKHYMLHVVKSFLETHHHVYSQVAIQCRIPLLQIAKDNNKYF